ncbi:hypothetical protein [Paenibacillus sp. MZ03-122A]|uniref:hypothetical protein n=1 Tax=Paenibacillus sp. MZ03-122A TaxID=2962033 RepID=UPI0020B89423|nr:hypothetical protein [Paenibacillus sp. MZ03-122A]MCP3778784.1 hypothetical protein [Paenibacillus sp. MZ03-122A]
MKKPEIKLEEVMYTPHYDPKAKPYPVHVINGAHKAPWSQGYIRCTGCGKGHHYRWNQGGPWIQIKCPSCGSLSAWWEEYGDDEEDGEEQQ